MIFRTFFCILQPAFGHGRLGHPQSLEYFFNLPCWGKFDMWPDFQSVLFLELCDWLIGIYSQLKNGFCWLLCCIQLPCRGTVRCTVSSWQGPLRLLTKSNFLNSADANEMKLGKIQKEITCCVEVYLEVSFTESN